MAALLAGVGLLATPRANANDLEKVIRLAQQANAEAAKSQERIDEMHDDTQGMLSDYLQLRRQIDSLEVYNQQLQELIASQEEEMVDLQRQIDQATMVSREISPLMLRMLDSLEKFVELDMPFLMKERRKRIERLRETMNRSDVSESEKFRQVLKAYQVEADYGRTIEAYQGKLGVEGDNRTLNFLRIGRIALIYQTLDGKEMGVWDQRSGEWKPLPGTYRNEIRQGLRMAREQAAPDLLRLPIPAPEDA